MEDFTAHIAFKEEELRAKKYEDQYISRFGSHVSLKFSGDGRGILPVGLGPLNTGLPLFLGVMLDGHIWSLPLHYPPGFNGDTNLGDLKISRTMNSVTLSAGEDMKGLEGRWTFISPFYPKETLLSSAPIFYIQCSLKNTSQEPLQPSLIAGLEKGALMRESDSLIKEQKVAANFRGPEVKDGKLLHFKLGLTSLDAEYSCTAFDNKSARWQAFQKQKTLLPGQEMTYTCMLSLYNEDPYVIEYLDQHLDYFYKGQIHDIKSLIAYGKQNMRENLRKSNIFDAIISEASLPEDIKRYIQWNFHIFLGCTWLLQDEEGQTIFTNYEGGAGYFSTIDVEYNLVLFYLYFWPELLASQVDLWATIYNRGNSIRPHSFGRKHGIMEHDIGGGFKIDEQVYILGPMPVEENSNFILLNYIYYFYTGDLSRFEAYKDICLELADYSIQSDYNGNGLPNRGTNNTLDCFSTIMRDMEDQIFLGIKAGSALLALATLLDRSHTSGSKKYRDFAHKIFRTVEESGWQEDHYVITLSEEKPHGWEGNTPLTTNGLAYLFFTGLDIPMRLDRIKKDLESTRDVYTIWPSMGVWRDMIAQYLGVEKSQEYLFRPDFRGDMYPRSFTSLGWLQAVIGLSYNRVDKKIKIAQPKPGYYPLPPIAHWEGERIPAIIINNDGSYEIKNGEGLLDQWTIIVEGVD